MRVRQNGHSEADADVLSALAQRAEHDLRAWGAGETEQEVVLHEPRPVEPHPVRKLHLRDGLLVQRVPINLIAFKRALHFE